MQLKRFLFIATIGVIVIGCFAVINLRYDPLARYPYEGEEMRETLRENLNNREISYIIEYSIHPDVFVDYVEVENFNIYHADEYKYLSQYLWTNEFGYPDPNQIVYMVESTRDMISGEDLGRYLVHYPFNVVEEWLTTEKHYNPNDILVKNPTQITLYLNQEATIFKYVPRDLEVLQEAIPSDNDVAEIYVSQKIQQPLLNLCTAIEQDLSTRNCAGLMVRYGYIDYDRQVEIYQRNLDIHGDDVLKFTEYPGHSESQTGLAIDFTLKGVADADFSNSEQYQWLHTNAHEFGFIQTYGEKEAVEINKVPRPTHFRYIGIDAARYLYNNGLSLMDLEK